MAILDDLDISGEFFDWKSLAKCKHMPPDLFFEFSEEKPLVYASVQECCSLCPVNKQCLSSGLNNSESGVWGGQMLDRGKIV